MILQARFKMGSAFADDGWQGLSANTNYTCMFMSCYGVPPLYKDYLNGDMLPGQARRFMNLNTDKQKQDEQQRTKALAHNFSQLKTIFFPKCLKTFKSFTPAHVRSCDRIMSLFDQPPKPFPWKHEWVKLFFDFKQNCNAIIPRTPKQELLFKKGEDFLQKGKIYLVRPPDQDKRGESDSGKPFWLAMWHGDSSESPGIDARVSWLDQPAEHNPYTQKWIRSKDKTTTAYVALTAPAVLTVKGVLHQASVKVVKYYLEQWQDEDLLSPESDEEVLG